MCYIFCLKEYNICYTVTHLLWEILGKYIIGCDERIKKIMENVWLKSKRDVYENMKRKLLESFMSYHDVNYVCSPLKYV